MLYTEQEPFFAHIKQAVSQAMDTLGITQTKVILLVVVNDSVTEAEDFMYDLHINGEELGNDLAITQALNETISEAASLRMNDLVTYETNERFIQNLLHKYENQDLGTAHELSYEYVGRELIQHGFLLLCEQTEN